MLCSAVEHYIETAKGLPFFYLVGDEDYLESLEALKQRNLKVIRISDFCPKEDKFPDLDELIDQFRTSDVDYRNNRCVVLGLGGYLALRGTWFAEQALRRLKDTTLGNARVVLLLRCVASQIKNLAKEDPRLEQRNRLFIADHLQTDLKVLQINKALNLSQSGGIKSLLHALEDGEMGECETSTSLQLDNALLPVRSISTAYEALCWTDDHYRQLKAQWGTEAQWLQLLKSLPAKDRSLASVVAKQGDARALEEELSQKFSSPEPFQQWLYFIALKIRSAELQNIYFKFVVEQTDDFEQLKTNVMTAICSIPRQDPQFEAYYAARKKLVRPFSASELAPFFNQNGIDLEESLYRYTDNTALERQKILHWVAQFGYLDAVAQVYPALALYLKRYVFTCGKLSDELTAYFEQYKLQKVTNQIRPEFLERVNANAASPLYGALDTRDNVILAIEEKAQAFLYWIDALGVEYLTYITERAREKGLSIHIKIARADLPTITSINRTFYDQWPNAQKCKEERLDEIKHKDKGQFSYKEGQGAIHLEAELKIIDEVIEQAASWLSLHRYQKVVIASDHGASRLAVLHHQEEKYETDTKGEHSGRCCKAFPECDVPYALNENGYCVLADYGRFKKSRAANVEVHGGASLEEVVVPIITLSLKTQAERQIVLVNPDQLYADRHQGTELSLYLSFAEHPDRVSLMLDQKRYPAIAIDDTHFKVVLSDLKRAKKACKADLYDGDDHIGQLEFEVKGKAAKVNNDFDDLF